MTATTELQRNRHLLERRHNDITLAGSGEGVTTKGNSAEAIVLGNSDTLDIAVGATVATAGERTPTESSRVSNATISNAGAIATEGDQCLRHLALLAAATR